MQIFYPEIKPYQRHEIAVEPPHELYVDESGNPDGIPILFVHGALSFSINVARGAHVLMPNWKTTLPKNLWRIWK
jgi:hypothetical protein